MAAKSKRTVPDIELMAGGHAACAGCGASLAMRLLLKGLGPDTVLVIPACCWAVIPGPMPGSCLDVPTVFSSFEAAASFASGVKAGLRRRGLDRVNVIAFAGDGGTADIGLQALSGAAERNDDIIYVCYDNEAYMNTGVQRSGATPPGAWTNTTQGALRKATAKKDVPAIMAAHGVPYVATANPAFPEDLVAKAHKAAGMRGTRYLHILADCPTGWKHDPSLMVEVGRLATTSLAWPLYEVEDGAWRITKTPQHTTPLAQYLRAQGRFAELTDGDIKDMQARVDARWRELQARATTSPRRSAAEPAPVSVAT